MSLAAASSSAVGFARFFPATEIPVVTLCALWTELFFNLWPYQMCASPQVQRRPGLMRRWRQGQVQHLPQVQQPGCRWCCRTGLASPAAPTSGSIYLSFYHHVKLLRLWDDLHAGVVHDHRLKVYVGIKLGHLNISKDFKRLSQQPPPDSSEGRDHHQASWYLPCGHKSPDKEINTKRKYENCRPFCDCVLQRSQMQTWQSDATWPWWSPRNIKHYNVSSKAKCGSPSNTQRPPSLTRALLPSTRPPLTPSQSPCQRWQLMMKEFTVSISECLVWTPGSDRAFTTLGNDEIIWVGAGYKTPCV